MKINCKQIITLYLETILEIIEDQPSFIIPIYFYCFLIWVYYHQIAGYIFSHFEQKEITEPKWGYIAYLNEVSPVTFLLYMRIFFTPYIEINSGMIVCGGNSFLVMYREIDESCEGKPAYLIILGYVGIVLTLITGLIVVFFFRNYEFNEGNVLKRRFNHLLIIQLFTRFMMTFFYYLNLDIVLVFKHIAAQFVGLSLIYDIIINWPFRNPTISKFYITATVFFELAMSLCLIWIFIEDVSDQHLFYTFFTLGTICSGCLIAVWQNKYNRIMNLNNSNFSIYYKHLDFYIEEIYRLGIDCEKNGESKFRLLKVLKMHKESCVNKSCVCKQTEFIDYQTGDIIMGEINELIINLFTYYLNNSILEKNRDEFEHISLKFISFLSRIINNPFRAYFEIKGILAKRKGISNYFNQISKIMSVTIERQIELKQKDQLDYNQVDLSGELHLGSLYDLEQLKQNFIPQFLQYMKDKSTIWTKIRKGYDSFDEFVVDGVNFTTQGLQIKNNFNKFLTQKLNKQHLRTILYYKLDALYQTTILNRINKAIKIHTAGNEIYKQDLTKSKDIVTNYMFQEGLVENFRISICKEIGKIISKKTIKQAQLFKYNFTRFENVSKIDQLMPAFIAQRHNEFIKNIIVRGYSKVMKAKHQTFGLDEKGFIFPVNLYLDSCFEYFDDFCISATLLKIDTSEQFIIMSEDSKILGISNIIYDQLFSQDSNAKLNFQLPQQTLTNNKSNFTKSTFVKGNNFNQTAQTMLSTKASKATTVKDKQDKYIIPLEELYNCYLVLFMPFLVRQIEQNIEDFEFKLESGVVCQNQRCKFTINKLFSQICASYDTHTKSVQKQSLQLGVQEDIKDFKQFYEENQQIFEVRPLIKSFQVYYNLSYHTYCYGKEQNKFYRVYQMSIKEIIHDSGKVRESQAGNFDTGTQSFDQMYSIKSLTRKSVKTNDSDKRMNLNIDNDQGTNFKKAMVQSYQPDQSTIDPTNNQDMVQIKEEQQDQQITEEIEPQELVFDQENNKNQQQDSNRSDHNQNSEKQQQYKSNKSLASKKTVQEKLLNYEEGDDLYSNMPSQMQDDNEKQNSSPVNDYQENNYDEFKQLTEMLEGHNSDNESLQNKQLNGSKDQKQDIDKYKSISNFDASNKSNNKGKKTKDLSKSKLAKGTQQNSIKSNTTLLDTIQDQVLDQLVQNSVLPTSYNQFKYMIYIFLLVFIILLVVSLIVMVDEFESYYNMQSKGIIPSQIITYVSQATLASIFFLEREHKLIQLDQAEDEYLVDIMKTYMESSIQGIDKINEENLSYFVNIVDDQDIFQVSFFSENQKLNYRLQFNEFMLLTTEKFRQILHNVNQNKIEPQAQNYDNQGNLIYPEIVQVDSNITDESIFYVIQNYQKISDTIIEIIKRDMDVIKNQEDVILQNDIIFSLIAFFSFFLILLGSIPTLKRIMSYQEKILMLICRTYEFETHIEQKRIQQFCDMLTNPLEEWLKIDFIQIMTAEVTSDVIKEATKKQNMISTKIDNQKISFNRYIIIFAIAGFLGSVFFSVLIIIFETIVSGMSEAEKLSLSNQTANHSLNNLIIQTELVSVQEQLKKLSNQYPYITYSTLYEQLQNSQQELSDYTLNFQNTLKKADIFTDSEVRNIKEIFEDRICEQIDCPSNTPSVFNEGINTIISSYNQLINSNQGIFLESQNIPWSELIFYLDQQEHKNLIYQGHQIPIQALMKLNEIIMDSSKTVVDQIILINTLYLVLVGIILSTLFIILGIKLKSQLRDRIQCVNFLLSIVPVEKWQEEATSQMLKGIYKISI